MNARQGKCSHCRIRIVWRATLLPLYKAHCHRCGQPLERTTHLVDLPEVRLPRSRPLTYVEARRRFGAWWLK